MAISETPLSKAQLEEARGAVLDNARSLLDDALVLLNSNRYARSYSLSVLACEEMAKLTMLHHAEKAVALRRFTVLGVFASDVRSVLRSPTPSGLGPSTNSSISLSVSLCG
jgi:hypothetical protein